MTTIKNVGTKIKKKFDHFLTEWYFFHPALTFGFFFDPLIEVIEGKHTTGEAIALTFTFFGLNLFFNAIWSYRKFLIDKEKNEKHWKKVSALRERIEELEERERKGGVSRCL